MNFRTSFEDMFCSNRCEIAQDHFDEKSIKKGTITDPRQTNTRLDKPYI